MTYTTVFPPKAYFKISNMGEFGLVLNELQVSEAGDIEKAAQSIDDDTVSFHLLEDGVLTDVSEDVARDWWRLYGDNENERVEFDENDEPDCPDFIRHHCSEQLDELYGELETQRADHLQAQRDYYRGLGV